MAPLQPLECYVLAARVGLEALAVAVSPYTLSIPLAAISDEDAVRMGAYHLKRLFFLHLGRMDALKRILSRQPTHHPPLEGCDGVVRSLRIRDAWAKKVAEIVWDHCPSAWFESN